MTIAYKLFRKRKDGTLGPLFINATLRVPIGEWLQAETHHRKKGFKYRPGWHATFEPVAPHLSERGRVWAKIEVEDYTTYDRPESQGDSWILANRIRVLEIL